MRITITKTPGISYAALKDWPAADRTYRLALRLWSDVARGSLSSASLSSSSSSLSSFASSSSSSSSSSSAKKSDVAPVSTALLLQQQV